MSKQPQELVGYQALIVTAFRKCQTTAPKLHVYYLEERMKEGLSSLAHGEGRDAFRDWMEGRSEPSGTRLVFVCRALNRRLVEVGEDPMMPDLPFPRVVLPPTDDGISSTAPDSHSPGSHNTPVERVAA